MPRYFFNIVGPRELIDPGGLICRDDRSAIEKAEHIAKTFGGTGFVVVIAANCREVARIAIAGKPLTRRSIE